MIILTRLGNGLPIAVNPDLIERAEPTPDTILTLIDGHKLVIEEPLEEVVALIREWRSSIAAAAIRMSALTDPDRVQDDAADADALAELGHVADSSAHQSQATGRVLRLPAREV